MIREKINAIQHPVDKLAMAQEEKTKGNEALKHDVKD